MRILALAVSLWALGQQAHAAARIAITSFQLKGDTTNESLRTTFVSDAQRGLVNAKLEVMPESEWRPKVGADSCASVECLKHLADAGVGHALRVEMTSTGS